MVVRGGEGVACGLCLLRRSLPFPERHDVGCCLGLFDHQGTGKTHTMLGVDMWMLANAAEQMVGSRGSSSAADDTAQDALLDTAFRRRDKWGIIPRAMAFLFEQFEAHRDSYTVRVWCSYTEIYNEVRWMAE